MRNFFKVAVKAEKKSKVTKYKISHGNLGTWNKKRDAFFATNPRCKVCHGKIQHLTKTGMCGKCRVQFNKEKFNRKNPDYYKKYNKGEC